jgi:2-polyprenyl-3-methyl-5-hydroxy-6-metoxy-1,4-benzoquinol methylase
MQSVPYGEYKIFLGSSRACLICNTDSEGTEREVWAVDRYFKALKCQECGLITIDPGLTEKGLQKYYQDNMGRRLDQKKKLEDRKLQYQLDNQMIEKHINKGKVLDVGCGGGFFLSALSEDFNKYGIDIDEESINYGKENYGYTFKAEQIGEDSFSSNYFDLIIFRGVIEHMYDPKKALSRATELLKKGGFLYFCATPNVDSFCAELYREKWNLWHPIQHINHFSVKTLHNLCGKENYDIVDEDYPYLGTPYESQFDDYLKIKEDIKLMLNEDMDNINVSPPFWGNMLSLLLQKK